MAYARLAGTTIIVTIRKQTAPAGVFAPGKTANECHLQDLLESWRLKEERGCRERQSRAGLEEYF